MSEARDMDTAESLELLRHVQRSQATLEKQLGEIQESLFELMAKSPVRLSSRLSPDAFTKLSMSSHEQDFSATPSWADAMRRLKSASSQIDLILHDENHAKGNGKLPSIREPNKAINKSSSMLKSSSSLGLGCEEEEEVPLGLGGNEVGTASVSSRATRRRISGIRGTRPTTTLQRLVMSRYFSFASSFAIISNAIIIGCEVDYRATHVDTSTFFTTMQYTFLCVFALELSVRMLAYKERFFFSSDAWWNLFDMAMVFLSVFEVLDTVFLSRMGDSNRQLRSMFGIFRMFRVMRVFRVLRFSAQLRVMIFMILESIKSLGWLVCLLSSFLYVFSIIFTTGSTAYLGVAGSDQYEPNRKYRKEFEKNFSTVLKSLYSCFRSMTNGQAWGELMDPLLDMDMGWFYASFFIIFILFAVLCFLNVVTGVFVDGALEKSKQDREMIIEKELSLKKAYVQSLQAIFDETDTDESGTISQDEFEEYLKDERVQAYFSSLQIDVSDICALFQMLDGDKSGEIEFTALSRLWRILHGIHRQHHAPYARTDTPTTYTNGIDRKQENDQEIGAFF